MKAAYPHPRFLLALFSFVLLCLALSLLNLRALSRGRGCPRDRRFHQPARDG